MAEVTRLVRREQSMGALVQVRPQEGHLLLQRAEDGHARKVP